MTIVVYVGNTAPTVVGTLQEVKPNGSVGPVDLSAATVNFRMRSQFGSALLIDALAFIVNPGAGSVQYSWALADTTTAIDSSPGPYKAWWHLDYGGGVEVDAPEFDVLFLDHSSRRAVGPCTDWCSTQDVVACYSDVETGACLTSSVRMASEVLYEMSGRTFPGWCQATIRPCSDWGPCGGYQVLDRGHIVEWGGESWRGQDAPGCSCGFLQSVTLPGVAQGVVRVTIDGDVLDPDAYRLDPDNTLVRVDGDGWPVCQNMNAASTEAGTFEVVYAHGYSPPEVGRRAAVQLAHEFWLACSGRACKLPVGVTQIVRQGLTITRAASLFKDGATGLAMTDSFLAAYQADNVIVLSPETMTGERRTT